MALATAAVAAWRWSLGTAWSTWQAVRAAKAERRTAAVAEARPGTLAQARRAVDEMYTQVAESWLSQQPRLQKKQREFLEKALAFYEQFARESGTDPEVRLETSRAYLRIGKSRTSLASGARRKEASPPGPGPRQGLVADFPGIPEYRKHLARCYHGLGNGLQNPSKKVRAYRQALALYESLATDPATRAGPPRADSQYYSLGLLFRDLGRLPEAEQALRDSWSLQRR